LNPIKNIIYKWQLYTANRYTKKLGYAQNNNSKNIEFSSRIQDLINELSVLISRDYIPNLEKTGYVPLDQYRQDCGNVHSNILPFIENYYPELSPTLTIGSVYFQGTPLYKFNKKLLKSHQELGDFNTHVWITLGNDIVMDCTISSHLNINVYGRNTFGPILFGKIGGNFNFKGLSDINSYILKDYSGLVYKPVISGPEALNRFMPKTS
jgi:hypothetical protein